MKQDGYDPTRTHFAAAEQLLRLRSQTTGMEGLMRLEHAASYLQYGPQFFRRLRRAQEKVWRKGNAIRTERDKARQLLDWIVSGGSCSASTEYLRGIRDALDWVLGCEARWPRPAATAEEERAA